MPICICSNCGKSFESSRKTTKACSNNCRNTMLRRKDPEKYRTFSRESYHRTKEANTIKRLFKYAKARAIKKNIPFNIELSDIILPEVCPILNVRFSNEQKYSYSIDRIKPELGYVKGNIQVVSQLANAMKWSSTREERIAFANWVLTSEGGT